MYEVRHAGSKGLGVFATRWLCRGTRIMAESPMFAVQSERDVYPATQTMSISDKHWIKQLSVSSDRTPSLLERAQAAVDIARTRSRPTSDVVSEHLSLLAAFRNNNFDIGNGTQALFRDACRLNHSCIPNSQANLNSATGRFTIHATRAIEDKEEITISYLDEHGAAKDARQSRLQSGYGFTCDCPACDLITPRGQRGEQRRLQLSKHLGLFATRASLGEDPGDAAELRLLEDVIELFELEGLAGRELATM